MTAYLKLIFGLFSRWNHRLEFRSPPWAVAIGLLAVGLIACDGQTTPILGPDDSSDLSRAELTKVNGDGQEATVGTSLPSSLVARVVDEDGEPVANAPVQWTFLQGRGRRARTESSRSAVSDTTDSNGLTEVEWTLGTKADRQQATAEIVLLSYDAGSTASVADDNDSTTAAAPPPNDRGRKIGFEATAKADDPAQISVTPDSAKAQQGDTVRFETVVLDSYDNQIDSAEVEWRSSDANVAAVDGTGFVTGEAGGTAFIKALVQGAPKGGSGEFHTYEDSALVTVEASADTTTAEAADSTTAEPDTTVASVQVSPTSLSLDVGQSQQTEAWAFNASGDTLTTTESDFTWTSGDTGVATVSSSGELSGVGDGNTTITVSLDGETAQTSVSVTSGTSDSSGQWDRVIEDTTVVGNLRIASGETWLMGSNVRVEGNVLVKGSGTILAMRPGSSLKFEGADPDRYVGGGANFDAGPFQNDIGLWVWDGGSLDIRGTPKASWNRTGSDPTWNSSDEYWIAPTDEGDFDARPWAPGQAVPRVHAKVPAAEVANVTRDVVIQGPGHIHINSRVPQRIEYVRLDSMGVIRPNEGEDGARISRYALHFHFLGSGAAGTIVRGVAAVGSRGKVFVPHASHGITIENSVSVNSWADGLWWDHFSQEEEPDRDKHDTHDLLVDGLAVLGLNPPDRDYLGETARFSGFTLPSGQNMEIRNSVAAGVRNNKLSVGFNWVTGGQAVNPVWIFNQDNVAHNNKGPGIRFWTNLEHDHPVRDFVTYRNKNGGIQTGAYVNHVNYHDVTVVDNYIFHNSNSKEGEPLAGYERTEVYANDGPALIIGHRNVPAGDYLQIVETTLQAASGHPKMLVQDGKNPLFADFRDTNVQPSDIEFVTLSGGNDGSHIRGVENGVLKWEVRVDQSQKVVQEY